MNKQSCRGASAAREFLMSKWRFRLTLHLLRSYSPFGIRRMYHKSSPPLGTLTRVTMHRALIVASGAVVLFLCLTGPRLALAEGSLKRVNHIIIVMQENHSFDNYFGALAYAPGSPYHNA